MTNAEMMSGASKSARLRYRDETQAPYLAFLPAEALGLSGVLAVVVAGLVIGRRSASLFSPALRLQAIAVWDVLVFLLNGFAFAKKVALST